MWHGRDLYLSMAKIFSYALATILLMGIGASWIIDNTDYEVIGIDDLSGGYTENIHSKVKFYKFNLNDLESLKGVFEHEKIQIVYHFAAYAAEGLSPFIRKFNYNNMKQKKKRKMFANKIDYGTYMKAWRFKELKNYIPKVMEDNKLRDIYKRIKK